MFTEWLDFSLTNTPGALRHDKLLLLCIDKLASGICSVGIAVMEVGKSENHLTLHMPTNLKMQINLRCTQAFIHLTTGAFSWGETRRACVGSDHLEASGVGQPASPIITNKGLFQPLWKSKRK